MNFNFSFSYTVTTGGKTVSIYPQHVRASSKWRYMRYRWFLEIQDGESLVRFSRPLGTAGVIAKIKEFGIDAELADWIASGYEASANSPWKSDVDASDCVYFVLAVGANRVKIGWARSFRGRYENLVSASPFPLQILLTMPGKRAEEKVLHERFSQYRVCNEWFLYSKEIREFIFDNATN